ncbi:FadR/GntR family transcriptional regulator [Rhodococcus rhodochrous]|nr:FadR/GntR family transcriptional regulator [Rhodococcus rhodochrous]
MREPVRHTPLVTQVSQQFRELIASGEWAIGRKIPGELELAEQLGVSRGTVREALRGLTITGLLEPRVGDGTYVRATNEITGVLVRDDYSTALDHVLDTRAGLEAISARLAAQHSTPEALAAMSAALDARTRAHDAGDLDAYTKADTDFHRAVVQASGNPLLARLHAAVAEVLNAPLMHASTFPEGPGIGDAHRDLVRAIENGSPDDATRIAYELIESVKAAVPPG